MAYHVNETGEIRPCRARRRPCRFGKENHFVTKEEAKAFLEGETSAGFAKELLPYLEDGPLGFPMLRHPLVYDLVALPELSNRRLDYKKKALKESEDKGAWEAYVFLHERPWRTHALVELQARGVSLPPALLTSVWMDSENLWENMAAWKNFLSELRRNGKHLGREEDFQALPKELTIYRGCEERNSKGFSWTLSEEKARWFAQRLGGQGRVLRASIEKIAVAGYIKKRGEEEIVLWPETLTKLKSVELS